MKEMRRRIARLESEHSRDAATLCSDHGLDPETYARALAELTRLMSTPLPAWPADARAAVYAWVDGYEAGRGAARARP